MESNIFNSLQQTINDVFSNLYAITYDDNDAVASVSRTPKTGYAFPQGDIMPSLIHEIISNGYGDFGTTTNGIIRALMNQGIITPYNRRTNNTTNQVVLLNPKLKSLFEQAISDSKIRRQLILYLALAITPNQRFTSDIDINRYIDDLVYDQLDLSDQHAAIYLAKLLKGAINSYDFLKQLVDSGYIHVPDLNNMYASIRLEPAYKNRKQLFDTIKKYILDILPGLLPSLFNDDIDDDIDSVLPDGTIEEQEAEEPEVVVEEQTDEEPTDDKKVKVVEKAPRVPTNEGEKYIIVQGDTLSEIAKDWGVPVLTIIDYNADNSAIKNKDTIYYGRSILRPTKGWKPTPKQEKVITSNNESRPVTDYDVILNNGITHEKLDKSQLDIVPSVDFRGLSDNQQRYLLKHKKELMKARSLKEDGELIINEILQGMPVKKYGGRLLPKRNILSTQFV